MPATGQPAALAQFRSIGGVAVDPQGRIYISDPQANRVRRIGADGVIQTVAGTGLRGSAGDGGPATQAELTEPTRLLVDGAGVLLIAELHRVRRVALDGTITTVIGDGQPGIEGDGGPASLARLAGNAGMALDGEGTLFIAERAAHRVRRIGPDGIVTTMAGTGVAGSSGDGGAAATAQLNQPVDVDVDAFANVLIAELGGNRIRRVSGQSSVAAIHTLAGTGEPGMGGDGGSAVSAQLHGPQAVAVDTDGNVFVADWNNRRVRRIDPSGGITTIAGDIQQPSASGRLAVDTRLELPVDVTVTTRGELLIVEQGTRRLRALVPIAQIPAEPEAPAAPPYRPPAPARALPPPVAGELIAEVFAGRGEPGYDGEGGSREDAQFTTPRGIAVDNVGRVLVADTGNHRIRRVELDGSVRTVAGTGSPGFSGDGGLATAAQLNRPHHVTVDAQGALYIADAGNFRVRRVSPEGVIGTMVGGSAPGSAGDGGPATFASLTEPVGVALDPSGRLYVVDAPAHRVRRVDRDGTVFTIAGTGDFGSGGDGGPGAAAAVGFPQRVVVDAAGDVLISQLQAGVVRRLRRDGSIELAAGSSGHHRARRGTGRVGPHRGSHWACGGCRRRVLRGRKRRGNGDGRWRWRRARDRRRPDRPRGSPEDPLARFRCSPPSILRLPMTGASICSRDAASCGALLRPACQLSPPPRHRRPERRTPRHHRPGRRTPRPRPRPMLRQRRPRPSNRPPMSRPPSRP